MSLFSVIFLLLMSDFMVLRGSICSTNTDCLLAAEIFVFIEKPGSLADFYGCYMCVERMCSWNVSAWVSIGPTLLIIFKLFKIY